jgi:diguanylate cyclase (GGDEF)-like protein
MYKWTLAFAVLLGWLPAVWAAAPTPLTSLHAIQSSAEVQSGKEMPAAFLATVLYFRSYERTLFVQDGDDAMFIMATTDAKLLPGDRIFIRGTTSGSFRPIVFSSDITILQHGELPAAKPATFDELINARWDCRLVSIRGVVRAADVTASGPYRNAQIQVLVEGGLIQVVLDSDDNAALKELLDAEVEVTGVSSGVFDGKMQQTGAALHLSSLAGVRVLHRATTSPLDLPITPMDQILTTYHVTDRTGRVHIQGVVTYNLPGEAFVLQQEQKSLWVMTTDYPDLNIGDQLDVTGFPTVRNGFLALQQGELLNRKPHGPLSPRPSSWHDLASSHYLFDLVSVDGQVVTEVRETAQDEYLLLADGHLFSAIIRRPISMDPAKLTPMRMVPIGSRVRVSGICVLGIANPYVEQVPFNVLMNSYDDITILARPSLLSVRNLIAVIGVLLLVLMGLALRGWRLERKVVRQTSAISARNEAEASLERQRSLILEQINSSQPLDQIIPQIVQMVSSQLGGAPCWYQAADGSSFGNSPPTGNELRIVQRQICDRSGILQAVLFAALEPKSKPSAIETETLSAAAHLFSLAVETHRLYSDLHHRSEFDLLTDIHNRFSLERALDASIVAAKQSGARFGLIYLDLDKFKQVNDRYGHHIGDLYLQEVARRMKAQLRSQDMLARLGGDEFAIIISTVHSREDAHEVIRRIEHSFEHPMVLERHVLYAAISAGIALYPDDGNGRDKLLHAADQAMYAVKNGKRKSVESGAVETKHS